VLQEGIACEVDGQTLEIDIVAERDGHPCAFDLVRLDGPPGVGLPAVVWADLDVFVETGEVSLWLLAFIEA
jgi:hypothetical protein